MVVKADLDRSARKLMEFLEKTRAEPPLVFTGCYGFPNNACEGTSLIFAYLVDEAFPTACPVIIKGANPMGTGDHYWVMVGDLVYDLTAAQFEGFEPVLGSSIHPLGACFPDQIVHDDRSHVDRESVLELHRLGLIPF